MNPRSRLLHHHAHSLHQHRHQSPTPPLISHLATNVCSTRRPGARSRPRVNGQSSRHFHDYFVTLLPSSSQHPDSRSAGPTHRLPRDKSTPHDDNDADRRPSSFHAPPGRQGSRDMTTVRIPLKSAKHHFGAHCVRGTRPYNEDTFQAGTIEIPAFARRAPVSVTANSKDGSSAENTSGDPQVFYFGVFDGHGGDMCSKFLRDGLHGYLERAAAAFDMQSTLKGWRERRRRTASPEEPDTSPAAAAADAQDTGTGRDAPRAQSLTKEVVTQWRDTVGGYFRRFRPEFFVEDAGGKGLTLKPQVLRGDGLARDPGGGGGDEASSIDQVLTYAFLRADFDFTTSQQTPEPAAAEDDDEEDALEGAMGRHAHHSMEAFQGGSTASVLLISTPSPTPFWTPSTPLSLATAHLGDTRILLCSTATGAAVPLTHDHHPDSPPEAARLRRYAAAFTTDSFGEERFATGLANTRSFGDARSKRLGVSAEPELALVHLAAGDAAFVVLVSDGVSGTLSDQEIVDVVKEARTPELAARDVVALAEELAAGSHGDADNATALCVRLGGWERRNEGGNGSLGTKEQRDWRRQEAADPRRGRTM